MITNMTKAELADSLVEQVSMNKRDAKDVKLSTLAP